MSTHFTAFISYRHCEPDATIAGHIQRQLERYPIPKAIQKATGMQKIGRIFRDKEELPLSTNLGDDIEEALHNSDFLIVICSPRLMESAWCQREIALFLEEHPIERVLTVLVEGEPGDVVPEILRTNREPLSCDYRMPIRKAREIELPRLASSILGCRYDDLRQRERQYKNRRRTMILSAFLTAATLLSVYFFMTAQKIQENYEQSLRNQSIFLASESLELLDEGDRLTAINLALEALPKEEERPWTAEAEFALGRAVNAYGSTAEILAVNAFTHGGTVRGFFTSPDGEYLVSWDEHSKVYVWDTVTYALVHSFTPDCSMEYDPALCLPESRFLVGDFDGVYCYNYLTGELVWQNTDVCGGDLTLSQDQSQVLTCHTANKPIGILDTATGKVLHTLSLSEELLSGFPTITPMAISPSGKYLALTYSSVYGQEQILIYNLQQDTAVCPPLILNQAYDLLFTEDDRLLATGRTERANYSSSMTSYGFSTLQKAQTDIFCLDPDTAENLWENNFDFYLVLYHHSLTLIDYPTAEGGTRQVVCATFANVCPIFDLATGELLLRLELPDSAVATETKTDYLYWILNNGNYCAHKLGSESVGALSYFPSGVIEASTNGGFFVRTHNANQVLLFQSVKDDGWETFDQNVALTSPSGVAAVS
ncbi:MAG: toll/interleukin-1 receptor domain-containing protein, partial [Clostridia bacterium]|nr:toll/interleukin-1 receptor domain-containing protein [Clostridia bacterium]